MRLYVEPMDAVLVEFDTDGRVRFDGEEWCIPSLQETRAILYAAEAERAAIDELTDALEAVATLADSPRRVPESHD